MLNYMKEGSLMTPPQNSKRCKSYPTRVSRKHSAKEDASNQLFFSLSDYRNRLFLSNKVCDLETFFSSFKDANDLITWMKERPKVCTYQHEFEGPNDIIIIIPTSDVNGRFSKNCRESIFRGCKTIFVESGEPPDPYFNFAHSVNIGIKKAMEYKPKWIIVSNDDMYKIDEIEILKKNLLSLDTSKYDIVRTGITPSGYISRYTILGKFALAIIGRLKKDYKIETRYKIRYKFYGKERKILKKLIQKLLIIPLIEFDFAGSFVIINGQFCEELNGFVYDETYINDTEDIDLILRLGLTSNRIGQIKYRVGSLTGQSIGHGRLRYHFRGIAGRVYLNQKFGFRFDEISKINNLIRIK